MNAKDDSRPPWNHEIPYPQFKALYEMWVDKITCHMRMTGCDTSDSWVEVHSADPKKSMRLPAGWNQYFGFTGQHPRLIEPNYKGKAAYEDLKKIEAWERRNKRELAEYNRLKAKFG